MTSAPIEEALSFDISGALQGIAQIDDALSQVTQSFQVGLAQALETLTSAGQDVVPLADSLDVAGLGSAIDGAISEASAGATVPLEADTSGLTEGIDAATAVSPVIDVTADTAEAQTAIDALNTSPVTVDVDADTLQAQNELDALGVSATSASGGGGSGLRGLETAVLGVEAASGAAQGEVGGLGAAFSSLTPELAGVVAGGTAFVGFLGEAIKLGADAQAQQARFNTTFGASAEIVKNIDVGGLRVSLEELGKQTGTLNADLENSATRIGLLGAASGAAQPEVAKTASDLLGLAGALAASNPRFGDAATVADVFSRALSTGRTRSLIPYGVSLSQTAIQTEALAENTNKTKDTLTGYDKLVAGLTLALDQQGNTLGTKYAAGIQNAGIQLRALKVAVEETLTSIGQPLLQPAVESLKSLLPIAQEIGIVLGQLARIALPLFQSLVTLITPLTPILATFASGLGAIANVVNALPTPALLAAAAITALGVAAVQGSVDVTLLFAALDLATGPVGLLVGAISVLGIAVGHLGPGTQQAAVDTTQLADAFTLTADAAGNLSGAIGNAGTAVDAYLRKQFAIQTEGISGVEVLNLFGTSFHALEGALTGSTDAFNQYFSSLRTARPLTDAEFEANKRFSETITDGRIQLEANAKASLQNAAASGTLTTAQVQAAIAQTRAKDGTSDYISALSQLQPVIRANAAASLQQVISTGQLQEAFVRLKPAIAAGTITTADADTVAKRLGISVDDAKAAVDSLSKAMDQFVSQGLSALPSAGAAIDSFSSGISSARSSLDSALQQQSSAPSGGDAIAKAQEAAGRSIADAATKNAEQVGKAKDALNTAQADLTRALADRGKDQTAAVKAAQSQVDTAQASYNQALTKAGDANAKAVRDGNDKITSAQDAANKSQGDAAKAAGDAQQAYLDAIDPQKIIDATNAQTFAILKFQQDIDTLIQRGRTSLAAQLISEGPEKGAQAAASFVSDDAIAAGEERGLRLGARVRQGYQADLESHKAQLSGTIVTLADGSTVALSDALLQSGQAGGHALALGITSGFSTGLNTSTDQAQRKNSVGDSVRQAIANSKTFSDAQTAGQQAGNAAQGGFTSGFKPDEAASAAVGKVPAAITAASPIAKTTAETTAEGLTTAFASGLDFETKVRGALLRVPAALLQGIAGLVPIAHAQGETVGDAFVRGIATGLSHTTPLQGATNLLVTTLVANVNTSLSRIVVPTVNTGPPPGLPSAQTLAALAGSSIGGRPRAASDVNVRVDLHKVDVNPFHLGDEIAWHVKRNG